MVEDTSHSTSSQPQTDISPLQFPQHSLTRIPSTSDLSVRSADDLTAPDAAAALAGLRSQEDKMDPESSGHRRRRSSLMSNLDGAAPGNSRDKSSRSPPVGQGRIPEDPKLERADDDDMSTSEDVELDELSDDGLQDDEETGLTGKDKGKRKRKRRRNTLLDQRIAADVAITAEEKREADQNVVKKSLINGLLIGLWYLFSLSISLVSSLAIVHQTPLINPSITSGCSTQNTSISTSLYSRLAHICLCNFALLL
jgi:solute carrier family 35 protein C2